MFEVLKIAVSSLRLTFRLNLTNKSKYLSN